MQPRQGCKHLNADAISRKSITNNCLAITQKVDDIFDMTAEEQIDKFLRQIRQWVGTDTVPNIKQTLTFDYKDKSLLTRVKELIVVNGLCCLIKTARMASLSKIIPQ